MIIVRFLLLSGQFLAMVFNKVGAVGMTKHYRARIGENFKIWIKSHGGIIITQTVALPHLFYFFVGLAHISETLH